MAGSPQVQPRPTPHHLPSVVCSRVLPSPRITHRSPRLPSRFTAELLTQLCYFPLPLTTLAITTPLSSCTAESSPPASAPLPPAAPPSPPPPPHIDTPPSRLFFCGE